jgi:ABC-type multidrug transport system ATPase subunit
VLTKLKLLGKYKERSRVVLFEFHPGTTILIGPNGSGKSTTLSCIRNEVVPEKKVDEWGASVLDQTCYAKWGTNELGGSVMFPWMTESECLADAKRRGGVARFEEEEEEDAEKAETV